MGTRTLRVLVVDDYENIRRQICQLLVSQADIEVVCEAANGQEAVLKAREHRPDLVLMDVTMPTMNGLDAARIITQRLPSTRVVMVSQHDYSAIHEGSISGRCQRIRYQECSWP